MFTPHARQIHMGRLHINAWLVVVVLAAALVALGSWVAVDRATRDGPDNLASSQVAAMLRDRIEAMNASDAEATAAFYSKDAVLEEIENGVLAWTSNGRQEIADRFDAFLSYGIQSRTGTTTQLGPYVAQTYSWGSGGATDGQGILVFRLDENGKIAHEWVIVGWP